MNTKHILLALVMSFCVTNCLPAQTADLLGKSRRSDSKNTQNSTVTAVGRLKMDGLAAGVYSGISISLRAAQGSYDKQIGTGSNDVRNSLSNGKFSFASVPAGKPMILTIRFRPPTSADSVAYQATYRFGEGHEGNMGTFRVTLQPAAITCDR